MEIGENNNLHTIITGYNENSIFSDVIFIDSLGQKEEDTKRIIYKSKKGREEIKKCK